MDQQHIIDPQNHSTWIAASFIVALLALVVAVIGVYRNATTVVATQAQILKLNQKIEQLHGKTAAAAPQAATPASAP